MLNSRIAREREYFPFVTLSSPDAVSSLCSQNRDGNFMSNIPKTVDGVVLESRSPSSSSSSAAAAAAAAALSTSCQTYTILSTVSCSRSGQQQNYPQHYYLRYDNPHPHPHPHHHELHKQLFIMHPTRPKAGHCRRQ